MGGSLSRSVCIYIRSREGELAEVDPDVISCNKNIIKLFRSTGGS